jgi:hypothetical protein
MAKKLKITDIVAKAERLKTECNSLQGYNPTLVEDLYNDVIRIEDEYGDLIQDYRISNKRDLYSIIKYSLIAILITIIMGSFITLWVAMGTSWRDELVTARNGLEKEYDSKIEHKITELQNYLEKEQFQYLGYEKENIFGKTVWYKKR